MNNEEGLIRGIDYKKMTNEEFVVHLMNFHPSGALIQAYVIEALKHYSSLVAQQDPRNFKDAENQFINPYAWRAIGIDVLKTILAKYGATDKDREVVERIKAIVAEIAEEEKQKESIPKETKERVPYEH